jgi:hypothetical protein
MPADFLALRLGHVLCDGDWMTFPKAALCFAVVETRPMASHSVTHSHFKTASRFCWTTEKPLNQATTLIFRFLPDAARLVPLPFPGKGVGGDDELKDDDEAQ